MDAREGEWFAKRFAGWHPCGIRQQMLAWLWQLDFYAASAVFLVLNFLIFFGAFLAEKFIGRFFSAKDKQPAASLTVAGVILCLSTVTINSAITSAGWLLWKSGVIRLNTTGGAWQILRDTFVLVLAMDFALYVLHRIAHIPFFYKLAHYKHHEYREVRVLTLFVMSPLEALGFGSLWVLTLTFFPFTVESVIVFLNLNLFFGITAHSGHHLYPEKMRRAIAALGFTWPDFHRTHHERENENMGFYTRIWDLVFKTHSAAKA